MWLCGENLILPFHTSSHRLFEQSGREVVGISGRTRHWRSSHSAHNGPCCHSTFLSSPGLQRNIGSLERFLLDSPALGQVWPVEGKGSKCVDQGPLSVPTTPTLTLGYTIGGLSVSREFSEDLTLAIGFTVVSRHSRGSRGARVLVVMPACKQGPGPRRDPVCNKPQQDGNKPKILFAKESDIERERRAHLTVE